MRRFWVLCLLGVLGCAGAKPAKKAVSPPSPPAPAWAMEGGDSGHTSRTVSGPPATWQLARLVCVVDNSSEFQPEEYATPIVIDGVAYVGSSGKAFEAVRLTDGAVLWQVCTKGRVYTTAAYAGGLLIFGDDTGQVYALTTEGTEAWRFSVRYPVVSSPLVANGKVYLAVSDQNVFCLEAATGRPLWQYGRQFPRRNSLWRTLGLAYGEGRVYAGFSDGMVVALDGEIGGVVWRASVGSEKALGDVAAGPSFDAGKVYAGAFRGPTVCLDAATGHEVWKQPYEVSTGFALGPDLIYAGTPYGSLLALSRQDGKRVWETSLGEGIPTAPVLAAGTVVVGTSGGELWGIDGRTGKKTGDYSPGPGLHGQPLVFDQGVLFLSDGGRLNLVR